MMLKNVNCWTAKLEEVLSLLRACLLLTLLITTPDSKLEFILDQQMVDLKKAFF